MKVSWQLWRNETCQAGKFPCLECKSQSEDHRPRDRHHAGWRHDAMAQRVGNYLYVRRRQWALTQKELAFLFGYRNEAIISRFEARARRVPLRVAFACQLLFGAEPKEIFPTLFDQVEEGVVRRMYELYEQLKHAAPSKKTATKLQLLHDALARVTSSPPQEV